MDKSEEQIMEELKAASQRLHELSSLKRKGKPVEGKSRFSIAYSRKGAESPFAEDPYRAGKLKAEPPDVFGAFSLEKYADAGALSSTHEDARGWLEYLEKFYQRNFWYGDENVKIWAYYEDYDNWQDTYGMDAVLAVYHSGHGGMSADGVFRVPLGADWGGLGTRAYSDKMRLGNEQVNYIFWSTCVSCRVLDGHNPIRTWNKANKGFRMLFGYETNSTDSPNYGKNFWNKWKGGRSFSTAWMDGSWDISHHQAPSVVACGASAAEAKDRVFNERKLEWGHVSSNYWHWRWYYAATAANAIRDPCRALPEDLLVAELGLQEVDENYVLDVIERHGVDLELPREVQASNEGIFYIRDNDSRVAFGGDGSYEVQMASANLDNESQIAISRAKSIASESLKRFGLERKTDLTFDRVRLEGEAGTSSRESRDIDGLYITQTTVQFRQLINGLPVVTPGAGTVKVSIDNDGTVTAVQSSTSPIERLTDRPKNTTSSPAEESPLFKARAKEEADIERMFLGEWRSLLTQFVLRGGVPIQYSVVPGSTEIGYDIRGRTAILVAQREIEVDFGDGFFKRYKLVVPIVE